MSLLISTVLGGLGCLLLSQDTGVVVPKGVGGSTTAEGARPAADAKSIGRRLADEKVLRERVLAFYALVKDGKILAASDFVAPGSKDIFLGGDKPKPDSLTIDGLEWLENGEQARVSMAGQTFIFVAGQRLPSPMIFDSYWKRIGRRWMYFDPPIRERKTPFGIVRVDRSGKSLAGSTVDLKAKVAESLAKSTIGKGIEVDVKDIDLSRVRPGSASFKVTNGADGYINVIFGGTVLGGLEFSPATATLAPGQSADFVVKWTPGERADFGQDWGAVILQPINRRHQFKIRWSD